MNLTDEEIHNCLTAVMNEGRIPTYFLFSQDILSHKAQKWLIKLKYLELTSETMYISKFMGKNWYKNCPVSIDVPKLTLKGLWKIQVLREQNKDFDENFIDYSDIRLKS
jgi:hypothetical protein